MIIDEVRNQLDAGRRSIASRGPFARLLAEEGRQRGKEIIAHEPMRLSDFPATRRMHWN